MSRYQQDDDALVALDHVADDLVVEKFHRFPCNSFLGVLILLLLQRELDEKLLQLLVAVVNAKLLKTTGSYIHHIVYPLVCIISKP